MRVGAAAGSRVPIRTHIVCGSSAHAAVAVHHHQPTTNVRVALI